MSGAFGSILKVVTGLALLALVAHFSLAAYLAEVAPEAALYLDPRQPIALRGIAEKLVDDVQASRSARAAAAADNDSVARLRFARPPGASAAQPASQAKPDDQPGGASAAGDDAPILARARHLIEASLRREPLDYRSVTVLARIVELQGPPASAADQAEPYYRLAAKLSLHASDALYWLLRRNIEKGNYPEAISQADILMRTTARAHPAVVPALARLAEIPSVLPAVKALIAANPPWREPFFDKLPETVTDARTPLNLLLALKEAGHPPRNRELRTYLDFLMAHRFHTLAYYTWLQFLPDERLASAGLLFNGSFDSEPSGAPFDWVISTSGGTKAEMVPHPDEANKRALRIEFSIGRVQLALYQAVLLSPGSYSLTGHRKGGLEGLRGLRWRIYCIDTGRRMLTEAPMHLTRASGWEEFSLDFEIPPTSCTLQHVALELDARSSSEQLVRGTMWYADLQLRRLDGAPATSAARD